MKIAVACAGESEVAPHFGRSAFFKIFSVEEGRITPESMRSNTHGCSGGAGPDHLHDGGHAHDAAGHDDHHLALVQLLQDCQVLIVRGIGAHAADAFRRAGITLCAAGTVTPDQAVDAFVAEKLKPVHACGCACHH